MACVRSPSMCMFSLIVICLTLALHAAGECVFDDTKCQCSEMRSPGSECLHAETTHGLSTTCKSVSCEETGMKCDCNGFEVCSVQTCPTKFMTVSGEKAPIGTSVECVSSTSSGGAVAGGVSPSAEAKCANEISSDWNAVIRTLEAAKTASDTSKLILSEMSAIVTFLKDAEKQMTDYLDTANGLAATFVSKLETSDLSTGEKESRRAEMQTLVSKLAQDNSQAVDNRATAEGDLVSVTILAGKSEEFYQKAVASDGLIKSSGEEIERLKKILQEQGDDGIHSISEQLYYITDIHVVERYQLEEHALSAGVHARSARKKIREGRVLAKESTEHKQDAEAKLQQSQSMIDALHP